MIINHNMASLNTYNKLSANNTQTSKALEKLSSGLRINRAGDDAAGLAISEKMRGQIRGLDQASRNSQDAISLIQTAESSLSETHSILQRMKELATQAANSTNTTDDRNEIQKEVNQLTSEINRIGNTTEFNTMKLLDGSKSGDASAALQRLTAATADQAFDYRLTVTDTATKGSISVNMGTENGSLGNITVKFVEDTDLASGKGVVSYDKDSKVVTVSTNGQVGLNADNVTGNWKFVDENGQEQATVIAAAGGTDLANSIGQAIAAQETSFDASKVTVSVKDATGAAVAAGTTINASSINGTSVTTSGGTAAPNVAGKISLVGLTAATGPSTAVEFNFGADNGAVLNGLKVEFKDATAVGGVAANKVLAEIGKDNNLIIYGNASETIAKADIDTAIQALGKQTINGSEVDFADVSVSSWDDVADYTNGGVANNNAIDFDDLTAFNGSSKLVVSGGESNNDIAPEGSGTAAGGALKMQIGANQGQNFAVTINDMRSLKLGISSISGASAASVNGAVFTSNKTNELTDASNTKNAEFALDVSDHDKASAAITVIDNAIKTVSAERSKLGAYTNRLEHTIANLGTSSENITAAESRIRDVDMAKEMMNFQKNNILSQAAQAMLAQANQQPQGVLQLLR